MGLPEPQGCRVGVARTGYFQKATLVGKGGMVGDSLEGPTLLPN